MIMILLNKNIIHYLIEKMAEPIKYLNIVCEIIKSYQDELIKYLKKCPIESMIEFKRVFTAQYHKLKETEINKSIDDKISSVCQEMNSFLLTSGRMNKTSQEHRYNLRSQEGKRLFRFTGGLKKDQDDDSRLEQLNQIDQIVKSYKISDQLGPRMRMKWKSPYEIDRKIESRDSSTIGNNNIDLLSFTIPQIENSIRRLSLQRSSPRAIKERQMDIHRTLESRSVKKKFIARLF